MTLEDKSKASFHVKDEGEMPFSPWGICIEREKAPRHRS